MEKKRDIEEIADLHEAVECDTPSHRTKELATLFINAMKDWPTYNQTKIADFVKELKSYFGNPLTFENIESKRLELAHEEDAWRYESGSAIAAMIDISTRFEGESDFDKILNRLLAYYKR